MSALNGWLDRSTGRSLVLVSQDAGHGEHVAGIMRGVHQRIRWRGGKERLWEFPFLPASVFALEEAASLLQLELKLSPDLQRVREEVRTETMKEEQIRKLLQTYLDNTSLPLADYTTQQTPPPWRHQALAYHWAIRTRVLYLMHKMGLGKTREGADIIRGKFELGHVRQPEQFLVGEGPSTVDPTKVLPEQWCTKGGVLIVSPAASMSEWTEQLWRWQGIQAIPITGTGTDAKRYRAGLAGYVHVVSYESLEIVERNIYDFIIGDELHYIASQDSNRYKRMMSLRNKAKHALALSGTPQSNGLESLWSQFMWLDGGRTLGPTLAGFKRSFLAKKDRTDGLDPEEAVSRAISRISWPLDMKQAFPDKPIKVNKVIHVPMTEEQANYYEKIRSQAEAEIITGKVTMMESMTRLTKLMQVTQGFVLDDKRIVQKFSSAKLAVVERLIKPGGDLEGKRVVIWCSFKAEVAMLQELLKRLGMKYLCWIGGMTPDQKDAVKKSWNEDASNTVLIGMISMGIGANFHAPTCVDAEGKPAKVFTAIFFGLSWKMTQVEQAMDRVYRGDQTESCLYVYLLSKDLVGGDRNKVVPIDVRVYETLMAKLDSAKKVNEQTISYVRTLLAA